MGLITGFIIQVGGKNGTWDNLSDGETAWISATVAGGTALLTLVAVMPLLKKNAIKAEERLQNRYACREKWRCLSCIQFFVQNPVSLVDTTLGRCRIAALQAEKDATGVEEGKAKDIDSDSDSKEAAADTKVRVC